MTEKTLKISLTRLPHNLDLPLPEYKTSGAAGMDLLAANDDEAPITLAPMERKLVPTGLVFEIPNGYEGQIRPRSGLALKHGITCLNTPGTIDSDYRGEVHVLLINLGSADFVINRGERIAQMIIAAAPQAQLIEISLATKTERGEGGFGSTGV
jgi:dUTP pyrophosphatase